MDDCPPPRIVTQPDGSFVSQPHCWQCYLRAAGVNQAAHSQEQKLNRKAERSPWKSNDVAKFILQHCKGTGRSYEWIVEKFSAGHVTKANTPEEFRGRMDNLYARWEWLRDEVDQQSDGRYKLVKEYRSDGLKSDGRPRAHRILKVIPVQAGLSDA